ncbi:hypothetical protein GHJ82_15125 [Sinorhizobium saheli]|nr:hypothetical protein [Sinorhizobium saheli]MQW88167.1 hypothetical protein [Sinorhizobium saheli]
MVGQGEQGTRKGGRRALWAAVAVVAIAAAGMTGYKIVVEKKIRALIVDRGGKVGTVQADLLGRIHLRDVALPLKEGADIRIAALDGRPKIFFLDGMAEVSGVEVDTALAKVAVPRATVEGANLDYGTLTALFGDRSELSLSKRVERFAAKRVSAPEVTVTQAVAGIEQKLVYKNVASEDIANGRIARYSASGAAFEVAVEAPEEEGGKKRMSGSIGAMTAEDIDAAYLARLYTEKAGPEDKEAKPVYGPISVKDIAFSDGEASFGYAEMRSSGISMRMPSEPLLEVLEELQAVAKTGDLPPAELQAYFKRMLTIVDMMAKADFEIRGMKVDGPSKSSDKAERIKFAIDRLALQVDGRKLDGALHGLSIGEDANYVKLAEASISGFSWDSTLEALRKFAALTEEQQETFPFTTLLPEFGTIRLAGLEGDLPADRGAAATGGEDSDEQGAAAEPGAGEPKAEPATPAPERIRFALKDYEVALTKPRNGIPTDVRVGYQDFALTILESMQEEPFVQLRQLGFKELVLSSNLAAAWDEKNQNLVIKDISMSARDIGSISVSGLVGGVSGDFFTGDPAKAQVALFGLTAREARLKIEDRGIVAKGIKRYTEENGMTEDEVRGMLTMTATAALQQFAADQPRLQAVLDAASRFIAKPGTFTLTARSKAESGIGAFEFVAASQNPLLLLDKVELEATAE